MAMARAYLFSSVVLLAGLAPALLPGSAGPVSITASSARNSDFNPKSVRVYVSLFDVNAAPGKEPAAIAQAPAPQKAQSGARASGESPRVLQDAETSSKQAERLKAFFGDALVSGAPEKWLQRGPCREHPP